MTNIIQIPNIMLPKQDVDMSKWATIACDQFCADHAYWQTLDSYVGDAPSTLRLVIPEIYLNGNMQPKIDAIHTAMSGYLKQGLLYNHTGIVLVERALSDGGKRVGIVVGIDLEAYDWNRIRVPVRATEDTIISRLPIRVDIRAKAELELPHALVLIDDNKKEIIEPLYAQRDSLKKLYDFKLNMGGGRIIGHAVQDAEPILAKLSALLDPETQISKYGSDAGIMLAVGDGNHSMAAAKICWDRLKQTLTPDQRISHPARFMLAEIINLYGGGMELQPIHRLLYRADNYAFVDGLKARLAGNGTLGIIIGGGTQYIDAPQDAATTIKLVQEYIEDYQKQHPAAKVEYVHNDKHLANAAASTGGVGLLMPYFPADGLFNYIVNVGNLPKKAFSIGEPEDKRYYLEAKMITK